MKLLALIVNANLQSEIADILRSIEIIDGFTLTNVEGHGAQSENDPFISTRDKVVGYTPHIRIDLLLENVHIPYVLETLRKSNIRLSKQSIYWITSVEEFGRL